jgi:anti-sigma factor RsiW
MTIGENHPSADELLLYSYGEVATIRAAEMDAHIASCAECHAQLLELERGRIAADWARERPGRRRVPWAMVALAAAAVVTAVLLVPGSSGPRKTPEAWPRQLEWSAHAGYIAGGRAMIAIDSQLTRLEQGWSYGRP